MNKYNETAPEGYIFALTETGYRRTPDEVKTERGVGKPVKGFEHQVPASWVRNGYVVIQRQN